MRDRFPIRIVRRQADDGLVFKATTSVEALRQGRTALEGQLALVELDYTATVAAARKLTPGSNLGRKRDPRAYWLLADVAARFLGRLAGLGFYLIKQNETLARDFGLSGSSLEKLLSFRRRFPSIDTVDPSISWERYRANKVIAPGSVAKRKSAEETLRLF